MGGIIAPFIVMASAGSAGGGSMVPFLTFGAASVLAGLLIFTLPETLGAPLPDTMEVGAAVKAALRPLLRERGGRGVPPLAINRKSTL